MEQRRKAVAPDSTGGRLTAQVPAASSTQSVGIVAVLARSGASLPEGGGRKTVEAVGELVAGIRHTDEDACDEPVAQLVLEEAESGEVI